MWRRGRGLVWRRRRGRRPFGAVEAVGVAIENVAERIVKIADALRRCLLAIVPARLMITLPGRDGRAIVVLHSERERFREGVTGHRHGGRTAGGDDNGGEESAEAHC